MSSDASNEMLSLLKELSVYKAMDEDYIAAQKVRWRQKLTRRASEDGRK